MKKTLLPLLFFFITITGYSQMTINDPQSWWGESPASLENVEYEVRTIGVYAEKSIAFDVKLTGDHYFYGEDQLEFVFDFQLNHGAVVNDSWLWIEDYISLGEVYEQGEGTQIYESIVDRQQDPSILTQLSSIDYNLKIYPLKWDSTRRVRISYFEPLDYHGKMAKTTLPLGLLNHSDISPENIKITVFGDESGNAVGLNSEDWLLLEEGQGHMVYTNNYLFDKGSYQDVSVGFSPQSSEAEYFLNTYQGEGESFYQLVYFPEIEVEYAGANRMLVFDYDSFTSDFSFDEIKDLMRSALNEMEDQDRFIVCYSDFVTRFSSDNWQAVNEENIEEAIASLDPELVSESKLSSLLPDAMNRIEDLGKQAQLVVLSPNNEFYPGNKAKLFVSQVKEFYDAMTTELSISFVDYARTKPGEIIDGLVYYGNDYIYQGISDYTGGDYISKRDGDDVYSGLYDFFAPASIYTDQYDFHISVDNGFVYADYNNINGGLELTGQRPIVSTGKYVGDGDLKVSFSALVGDNVYSESTTIGVNEGQSIGPITEKLWFSEFIKTEQHSGDPDQKREVIRTSIEERLLSLHTVFLCLEPGFESISANNNEGDGGVILSSVDEEESKEAKISVFPNPFVSKLKIEFQLDQINSNEEVSISILDSRGQLIERILLNSTLVIGTNTYTWIPEKAMNDSVYFIHLDLNDQRYTHKVLYVK